MRSTSLALIVRRMRAAALLLAVCVAGAGLLAQTPIKLPKNKYTPQQDVDLGREAAAEVRKQYPVIEDKEIARYLTSLGDRLVAAAPPELNQPVYQYSFTPLNVKEINAFALPGGPMFVYRGMIDAATDEAEVAGVMAHELAHVLLRHGTANATKAQNPWLQLGQLAGVVGGAVVGGGAGAVISQGSQFGLGTVLLKYSREFEQQADLLGVQIMARAGYDPRALARMFETIQAKSRGSSSPQWLSSHPNPGNRTVYINEEASRVTVARAADTSGFKAVKTLVAALPPPRASGDLARPASSATGSLESVGTPGKPIPLPSAQSQDIIGGKVFRASVPSNWTALRSKSAVKAVPQNGYGDVDGKTVFACGVEFGVLRASSRDLVDATNAWLGAVAQDNPDLRLAGEQQRARISDRTALVTPLVNRSSLGGRERVVVHTTFLADGATLFYYFTVVQEKDDDAYREVFERIRQSIRLTDAR